MQQKTNNPLTVPLTDLLVGRLADYVLDQRPDSPDEHVFLRSVAPHMRLADHASIHRVIATVFAQGRGDRREGRHSPAAPQRRVHGCCARRSRCRRSRPCWATRARNRPTCI